MVVTINNIKNEALKAIALKADADGNGKLENKEIEVFQSEAKKAGHNVTLKPVPTQPKAEEEISFSDSRWTGHQIEKLTGENAFTDWLQDKDKKCTDGKDDGKLSVGEGAWSFTKGIVGGIPKAMINHPLITVGTLGLGALATVATGGAILPVLTIAGGALSTVGIGAGVIGAATADNDADAKSSLENLGTSVTGAALSVLSFFKTLNVAKAAGVDTENGFLNMIKSCFTTSGKNIKANYVYYKDGIITKGANPTRQGVETSYQGNGKPLDAYKVNIDPNATVEQNLANNPGLLHDEQGYYVATSWGSKSYITEPDYMYVTYGPGDNNAVSRADFAPKYVDHAKFAADKTCEYIDPATLEPGQHVICTKQDPVAKFKIVPEGTKYIAKETKGVETVAPKSVLRIDGEGKPFQSTVDFMFNNFLKLKPEQIAQLKAVDPETAARYGY